jgi:transcriptional regulator with XRE-family HTH domain
MESKSPARIAGEVLRGLREQAGLTQAELATRVFCSQSLISGLERATKTAHPDLVALIDEAVNARGLIIKIWPVTASGEQSTEALADLEAQASHIHDWDSRAVPGLLQTPDYGRAVIQAANPRVSEEKINELCDKRIARQAIFTGGNPPAGWFVFDQSVLYRPFGGKVVMRSQLLRLEQAASQPNIIIQVVRFSEVEHPGSAGPLRIMEFSDKPPIWYTEGWSSGRMTDAHDEVVAAMENFNLIRATALSPGESARFIGKIRVSRYEK